MVSIFNLKILNNLNEVKKMILNKVMAKKNNTLDAGKNRSKALNLLIEEMAVWYPAS
jgi:hypothetical protein